MLLYRWRRPPAWASARAAGHRGAMFPWQSGSTGREESQIDASQPSSGRWLPTLVTSGMIVLAVAYNTWRYYEATGDDIDFLTGTARSHPVGRHVLGRPGHLRPGRRPVRHLRGDGPRRVPRRAADPGRPGLDDNAYTNVMAAWTRRARSSAWRSSRRDDDTVAGHPRHPPAGPGEMAARQPQAAAVLARRRPLQFRGYDDARRSSTGPATGGGTGTSAAWTGSWRPRGTRPTATRSPPGRRPDALPAAPADELYGVLDRLGYPHDRRTIPRTIAYYLDRTRHGSTLSKVVHSWVLARADRHKAWTTSSRP